MTSYLIQYKFCIPYKNQNIIFIGKELLVLKITRTKYLLYSKVAARKETSLF